MRRWLEQSQVFQMPKTAKSSAAREIPEIETPVSDGSVAWSSRHGRVSLQMEIAAGNRKIQVGKVLMRTAVAQVPQSNRTRTAISKWLPTREDYAGQRCVGASSGSTFRRRDFLGGRQDRPKGVRLPIPVDSSRRTLNSVGIRAVRFTIVIGLIFGCSCRQTRQVTQQMIWSVDQRPLPLRPLPSESVRLTFVEAPNHHVVITGVRDLLSQMRRLEKKNVSVEFDVTCKSWSTQVQWFNVRKIEQFSVPPSAGGWVESTAEESRVLGPFLGACN